MCGIARMRDGGSRRAKTQGARPITRPQDPSPTCPAARESEHPPKDPSRDSSKRSDSPARRAAWASTPRHRGQREHQALKPGHPRANASATPQAQVERVPRPATPPYCPGGQRPPQAQVERDNQARYTTLLLRKARGVRYVPGLPPADLGQRTP